jgi:hypothetical protein
MNMVRLRQLLFLGLAALLMLVTAWPVSADKPNVTIERVVNEQTTFEDCNGLTITRTLDGTIRTTEHFDDEGNLIRLVSQFHLHGSFINQANGVVLPFIIAETETININPDNSAIIATTGLIGRITVPGSGLVTADVGRIAFFFTGPDDPNPTLLFDAGRHDSGPFPFICPFLAG